MLHLGDRVKALRKSRKETQPALATALGLSTPAISTIETGGKTSEETIDALCKHYNVTREWLINGEGDAPKGVVLPIRPELNENPWKDALVQALKDENEFLKEVVRNLTGGGAAKRGFLVAFNGARGVKPSLNANAA